MNTGETVVIHFQESYRSVRKGDLFRVVRINAQQITLAAIDDDCLRDDEKGARRKSGRRGVKDRSILGSLAAIDEEEEG